MGLKPIPLAAVALLGVGNLLHIVSIATPEWGKADYSNSFIGVKLKTTSGLWKNCAEDVCKSIGDDEKEDWRKACQATAILGMLAGVASCVCSGLVVWLTHTEKGSPNVPAVLSMALSIVAFTLIATCLGVYGTNQYDVYYVGYSFGLGIAGAVLILIGGCIGLSARKG